MIKDGSYQDAIGVLEREIEARDHPQDDCIRLSRRILLSEDGRGDLSPVRTDDAEVGSERLIQRLEEALEIQRTTEGQIASTPRVRYCFECDEITVDYLSPPKCLYHPTVMSDGYEHGGVQSALTTFRYLDTGSEQND